MLRNLVSTTGLAAAAVLAVVVNLYSNTQLTSSRLDLTENQAYTLTDGTREVLGALDEPVTLRFYLSRELATSIPSVKAYADRVETLLDEFARAAGGMLRVQVIDPEPFSEEEDRAVGYGVRGIPVVAGGDPLYFGIVGTSSTDDRQVLPYLSDSRETLLEYDLTKLVYTLANPELPVVGLLSSLPIEGAGPQAALRGLSAPPWTVVTQMRELFEVRSLQPTITEVPADVDVLMLVHPRSFPATTLYAIDQFVMRGGRLLAFVDGNAEVQPQAGAGGMPMPFGGRNSELGNLLETWGVRLLDDTIIADLASAVTVRSDAGGRLVTFDYPVWMNVPQAQLSPDDVLTTQLGNVSFGTPGALEAVDGASSSFTPLVSTTEDAARFPADAVGPGADPQRLLRDYTRAGQAFVLAARVSGKLDSAFPDGPPAVEPGEDGETPAAPDASAHIASVAEGNLVVVADTDFLQDRFWVQVQNLLGQPLAVPIASNGSFVINALDNLTGSGALISVRNRGTSNRPFDRIEALRVEAETRFREKEQRLEVRLRETEDKLLALEQAKGGAAATATGDALVLSPEQREALQRFSDERLTIRKELRDVRLELRRDIDEVEGWLKFANIGAVPILIALGGLLAAVVQRRRHRARPASA